MEILSTPGFFAGCRCWLRIGAQSFENLFLLQGEWAGCPLFFLYMSDFGKENQDPVVKEITALVGPVLDDFGYELVDVQFKREQHGQILRIVIYKESGIIIDDCAKVSRELGHLLEVEDRIGMAYTLEVTSPGLDWRLKNERDFVRFKGKLVRVIALDEPEAIVGLIGEIDNGKVAIEVAGDKKLVPFESIKKAKLVIEF